jgi:copper chaperone CopZ
MISPRRGENRLSAGARGPAGIVADEKSALEIPDLQTQADVASVVQALRELKGVKAAVIDLNTHLAVVDYDPRVTELDRFLTACKAAGFEASEYRVESRFPKPIKLKGG